MKTAPTSGHNCGRPDWTTKRMEVAACICDISQPPWVVLFWPLADRRPLLADDKADPRRDRHSAASRDGPIGTAHLHRAKYIKWSIRPGEMRSAFGLLAEALLCSYQGHGGFGLEICQVGGKRLGSGPSPHHSAISRAFFFKS